MHVIARKTLTEFGTSHPDAQSALAAWFYEVRAAHWSNSAELKAAHATASILSHERAVFNICGNKYRLVVRINFVSQTAFVLFVGTHAQYDKINAETISWQRS